MNEADRKVDDLVRALAERAREYVAVVDGGAFDNLGPALSNLGEAFDALADEVGTDDADDEG